MWCDVIWPNFHAHMAMWADELSTKSRLAEWFKGTTQQYWRVITKIWIALKFWKKHEIEIEAKKYGDVVPSWTHVCVGCLADIGEVRENTKLVSHSPTTEFSTLHTDTNTDPNMDLKRDTFTNTNTEHTRQHVWCVWSCQKWRGLFFDC